MREGAEVPGELVGRLGEVCLALPETYQEPAWVGIRWWVRRRTFAHVLAIEDGWPPAYARAVGAAGPIMVLRFRSPAEEVDALGRAGWRSSCRTGGRMSSVWCWMATSTGRRSPSCSSKATASWRLVSWSSWWTGRATDSRQIAAGAARDTAEPVRHDRAGPPRHIRRRTIQYRNSGNGGRFAREHPVASLCRHPGAAASRGSVEEIAGYVPGDWPADIAAGPGGWHGHRAPAAPPHRTD